MNTPFANFTTAFSSNGPVNNNENHIAISPRNGNWVADELNNPFGPYPLSNCSGACSNNSITGPDNVCNDAFSVPDPGAGGSVSWSASPSGIVAINSPNAAQTTITRVADGIVTLTAVINSNTACTGSTSLTVTKTVSAGNVITGYYNVTSNHVTSSYNTLDYGGGSVFVPANESVLFYISIYNSTL